MTECRCDFETRSDVDLKTCGAAPYFASPHFRALGLSYRIEDGLLMDWEHGQPCPDDLRAHIERGGYIRAFNASFERQCFEQLHKRFGWPLPAIDRYRDTAAEAAALGLPRSLDGVGEALGLDIRKDKEGVRLIRKFSIPRRPRKDEDPRGVYWNEPEDHPEDYQLFVKYRRQDVLTEEAAAKRIIPLSASEQAVYTLNETINSRGIRIDVAGAHAALRLADKAKKTLDREINEATGGYVTAASQVSRLVEWVQQQGVTLDSAGKAEIVDLLEKEDIPVNVRRALELRQEAGKTSVSKLKAMLARASADGRVRGTSLYHGAGTGRFQSVGVNTSNLPRPRKIYEDEKPRTDVLFKALRQEDPDLLAFLYPQEPKPPAPELAKFLMPSQDGILGRPLHLIADAIRGFIWAAPGRDLIQADYSNIEGNVIAWLANEEWKLQAIRELIADPSLPDMYRRTAASILNTTTAIITKKHPLRQGVGKPAELGLSFGGGVMAFVTFARNYAVRLGPLYEPVWAAAEEERREKAVKSYEKYVKRGLYGTAVLDREAWIACEIIKTGWRAANSNIARMWKDLESVIREAVYSPGTITEAGKVQYKVAHGFLFARLPSGRCLAYAAPKLKAQVWAKALLPDGTWSDAEVMDRDAAERGEIKGTVKIEGATSDKVTFLGVDGATKCWQRSALYGGLAAENNTQATARDLLVNGMFRAEAAGYPIIATVYDEIISEVPRGFGSVEDFEREICVLPAWAEGLPLTAGGWRGKRYRKD